MKRAHHKNQGFTVNYVSPFSLCATVVLPFFQKIISSRPHTVFVKVKFCQIVLNETKNQLKNWNRIKSLLLYQFWSFKTLVWKSLCRQLVRLCRIRSPETIKILSLGINNLHMIKELVVVVANIFYWKESIPEFVVCINNEGYPASLELHKIYRVNPDKDAAGDENLRVIDESGEDYLYPESYFALIKVPAAVEESLLRASWITLDGEEANQGHRVRLVVKHRFWRGQIFA